MATHSITQERLKSLLTYDPDTGELRNRVQRNPRAPKGAVAGSRTTDGYISLMLFGRRYQAHRLIWLYQTGEWPSLEIDHINRVRHDNRWSNLRVATRLHNSWNTAPHAKSRSGVKGVAYVAKSGKWQVQMRVCGKTHYIGIYDTIAEAADARSEAERRLYAAADI